MRYVHAYPSYTLICVYIQRASRKEESSTARWKRARSLSSTASQWPRHHHYFSMVEIKVTRVHLVRGCMWRQIRFVYGWKYFETFSCVVRVRRWMKWYFERSNVRWQIGFNFVMIGFLFARLFAISFYV